MFIINCDYLLQREMLNEDMTIVWVIKVRISWVKHSLPRCRWLTSWELSIWFWNLRKVRITKYVSVCSTHTSRAQHITAHHRTAMDLICIEFNAQPVAYNDPVFIDDERVLKNLLSNQIRYTISSSYFKCLQTDLKPFMRKIVASWMLEVSKCFHCSCKISNIESLNLNDFIW